jgi:hypothetical protein
MAPRQPGGVAQRKRAAATETTVIDAAPAAAAAPTTSELAGTSLPPSTAAATKRPRAKRHTQRPAQLENLSARKPPYVSSITRLTPQASAIIAALASAAAYADLLQTFLTVVPDEDPRDPAHPRAAPARRYTLEHLNHTAVTMASGIQLADVARACVEAAADLPPSKPKRLLYESSDDEDAEAQDTGSQLSS